MERILARKTPSNTPNDNIELFESDIGFDLTYYYNSIGDNDRWFFSNSTQAGNAYDEADKEESFVSVCKKYGGL